MSDSDDDRREARALDTRASHTPPPAAPRHTPRRLALVPTAETSPLDHHPSNDTTLAARVVLRRTQPEEITAVLAFHAQDASAHLLGRTPEEHRRAIDEGLHFVVVDETQRLLATAAAFTFEEVCELGAARVEPAHRGFGLHPLLLQVRAVAVECAPAARQRAAFTAIDPRNATAWRNALDLGLQPWTEPPAVVFSPCDRCCKRAEALAQGARCCCRYLRLPPGARLAAMLALTESSPLQRVRAHDGAVLEIHLEVDLLAPEVLALATDELACTLPPAER